MTIGQWIGAGVALASLFITLITFLVKLTNTLTKLGGSIDSLSEKVTDINCENNKQHDNLFGIAREHGDKLADHETRISIIESKPPRTKRTA